MDEQFAVVFRDGSAQAAGALRVKQDRLLLSGRGDNGGLELEIPIASLAEVHVGRQPNERLNGYSTLILERRGLPAVMVAPLGVALLHEIADLLNSLSQPAAGDVLAVMVPLKPGCVGRARRLLAKGPPLDPASLGLSGHEVYLEDDKAIFVFRGSNVRAQVSGSARHPAVWRAGLAWQRCFASAPRIVDITHVGVDSDPAYRWTAPQEPTEAQP